MEILWYDQDPDFDPVDYSRDGFHSPGEAIHFEQTFLDALERALGPDLPLSVEHGGLRFDYLGDGDPAVYRPLVEAAWASAERDLKLRNQTTEQEKHSE
jgi:hypothetical protein